MRRIAHGPRLYGVVQRFVPRRIDGYYGHTLLTHTVSVVYASSDTANGSFRILAARMP